MIDLLFAIWFFLPAGAGNAAPIVLKVIPGLSRWKAPLDGGRLWRGKRLFGENKTWRGLIGGTIIGVLTIMLQAALVSEYSWAQQISNNVDYTAWYVPILGGLLAAGALLGDAVESMFKRQRGVPAGHSWFPYDQIDYIVGALLLSLFVVRLPFFYYVLMLIVWFVMHLIFTFIGYRMGLKDKPI